MPTYRVLQTETPPTASSNDPDPYTLGVEFVVSEACTLTQIHFWQPSSGTVSSVDRTVGVWENTNGTSGTLMGSTETLSVSGSGWQTKTLASPKTLAPGVVYVAGVFHPAGQYTATGAYFSTSGVTSGPVTYVAQTASLAGQMKFSTVGSFSFPGNSFNATNYWIDITVDVQEVIVTNSKFVAHNGTEWVTTPTKTWTHNGTAWIEV